MVIAFSERAADANRHRFAFLRMILARRRDRSFGFRPLAGSSRIAKPRKADTRPPMGFQSVVSKYCAQAASIDAARYGDHCRREGLLCLL
jgi:hypothetical protein